MLKSVDLYIYTYIITLLFDKNSYTSAYTMFHGPIDMDQSFVGSVFEFIEFEPRLKSAKIRF